MILDEILAHKREEVRERERCVPLSRLQELVIAQESTRSLREAISGEGVSVIAEVKRRSPSKGDLAPEADPVETAVRYEVNGAAAVSVLTDERFFAGSAENLINVRRAVGLPVLRKDFVLGEYQLLETRALGADAVLLIVAALEPDELAHLIEHALLLTLEPLVEVHDERELEVALDAGAPLIGINNRDLRTFEVSLDTTRRLLPLVPTGVPVVSESGIYSREQVDELGALSVSAVLVGEALMTAADPALKLRELAR